MTRIRIEATRAGNRADGWAVRVQDVESGAQVISQPLARCSAPYDRFPLPEPHDVGTCLPSTHELCVDTTGQAIADIAGRLSRLEVSTEDAKTFGCFLTRILFGDAWSVLTESAQQRQDVEVQVVIDGEDRDLLCLPWELMYELDGPLGASPTRKVAIMRVVQPLQPVAEPAEVEPPLKVLFVIGRQIDEVLRPGAEIIGLLRRLRVPVDPTFREFQSRDLNVRYLSEATWDEVQATVAEFRPTVVHLICHGEVDPGGHGTRLLLTARERDGDPSSPKLARPYLCSAEWLLQLLDVGGVKPAVVVVNACHTADISDDGSLSERGRSDMAFTARLVQGGVPMAVGMSGEVADRACQIFTLRFYMALLCGGSVPLATAHGRRAALLGFSDDPETASLEWARPTLFVADGISTELKIRQPTRDLNAISTGFRQIPFPETLCDRYEVLQQYEELRRFARDQRDVAPVMSFGVRLADSGFGKTRLLEEIAARSVFDAFAPVIVRNNMQNPDPPANWLEFALQIADGIHETRTNFTIESDPPVLTKAELFAYKMAGINPVQDDIVAMSTQRLDLKKFLNANRNAGERVTVDLQTALGLVRADCAQLIADLQSGGQSGRIVLLLLDDLHRYTGMYTELIAAARQYGIGTVAARIPLVFTFTAADTDGRNLEELLRKRSDIQKTWLGLWETETDQQLAFRQFVLSSFKYSVVSRPTKREQARGFYKAMLDFTAGRPGRFEDSTVKWLLRGFIDSKTLLEADFETSLRQWT